MGCQLPLELKSGGNLALPCMFTQDGSWVIVVIILEVGREYDTQMKDTH